MTNFIRITLISLWSCLLLLAPQSAAMGAGDNSDISAFSGGKVEIFAPIPAQDIQYAEIVRDDLPVGDTLVPKTSPFSGGEVEIFAPNPIVQTQYAAQIDDGSSFGDDPVSIGRAAENNTPVSAEITQYAEIAGDADAETGEHAEGGEDAHHSKHNDGPIVMDPAAQPAVFVLDHFGPDPVYPDEPYDAEAQLKIYGDKKAVKTPRPLVELGRDLYSGGTLGEGYDIFGEKNRAYPQLLIYGDARTAIAYNDDRGKDVAQVAARLNLDVNLQITSTERIHAFFRPIDSGAKFTRFEFGGGDKDPNANPKIETNFEPLTLFFEGDAGAILAGFTDEYKPYDLPFTFGRVPLLLQNGVWMEDAFIGGAFGIPARNSPRFDISNYDITFFVGLDEITTDAVRNSQGGRDDHDAKMLGAAGFFEFDEGYLETGYAYIHDTDPTDGDFSYHNLTAAFTKRYFGKISNSTRIIANVGQDPGNGIETTADGALLLFENSLVTHKPLTLVPYANFWAGLGKTQSLARAGGAGGVLRNTGLNFESDGLTGFPTLDASGINSVGGAIGLQNLFSLEQQIVVEVSAVIPHSASGRENKRAQFGAGVRYQRPLNEAVILRLDAMYGNFGGGESSSGLRMELRQKF